jgi:predicted NAD/FAD-binding protein
MTARQRIAIVGAGISGLTAYYLLREKHECRVFEAAPWIGGHTHTVEVDDPRGRVPVDTGFIVCNERTYPRFLELLRRLGVATQDSDMSFSVRCERSGLEYNGTSLDTLFAQRRNLLSPRFLFMVRDILRFNAEATRLARDPARGQGETAELTLRDFLAARSYGEAFVEQYLLPMGAAVWSTSRDRMLDFPFATFARFFDNHGFLQVEGRPQWLTIPGGSRRYVDRIVEGREDEVLANTPIEVVRRRADCVEVVPRGKPAQRFDSVVMATHSDQALALLEDPTIEERAVLGAIPYQPNSIVLHHDTSLLPKTRKAWAAWNYHRDGADEIGVTYWMKRLQALPADRDWCVTLNRDARIDPARVAWSGVKEHPLFTREGIAAQGRRDAISGRDRTFYCGAYWGYGFTRTASARRSR